MWVSKQDYEELKARLEQAQDTLQARERELNLRPSVYVQERQLNEVRTLREQIEAQGANIKRQSETIASLNEAYRELQEGFYDLAELGWPIDAHMNLHVNLKRIHAAVELDRAKKTVKDFTPPAAKTKGKKS